MNWKYFIFKNFPVIRYYVGLHADAKIFNELYDSCATPFLESQKKVVIFVCNNYVKHGGLVDRLKGIISTYKICKLYQIPFKIYHFSPYSLNSYLEHVYDWTIDENEIVYNLRYYEPHFVGSIGYIGERETQIYLLKKILKHRKSIHIYTNASIFSGTEFRELFDELFVVSDKLIQQLKYCNQLIGGGYISLSYRFLHLLGDDIDTEYPMLDETDCKKLIYKSINEIYKFKEQFPEKKILVNSDSNVFLDSIPQVKEVYINPGKSVHIDFSSDSSEADYMKTFVDFFMISNAEHVYLLKSDGMYLSQFPQYAALYGNKPFSVVEY